MAVASVASDRPGVLDAQVGDQTLIEVIHERLGRCHVDRGQSPASETYMPLIERRDGRFRLARGCRRGEQHVLTTNDFRHHGRLARIWLPSGEEDRKGVRHHTRQVGSAVTHPRASPPLKFAWPRHQ